MEEFATSIDEFLKFNRYEILEGHGVITQTAAKAKAVDVYRSLISIKELLLISIRK
jgi:hypothetical protein